MKPLTTLEYQGVAMINGKNILCIIPARSGSKGLPGKNTKLLAGKPLLAWPIDAANGSKYIDRTIVSTDCEDIAEIASQFGAEVPYLRPKKYAQDNSPSFDLIENLIINLNENYEYVILLEPTSPLTETKDIDKAIVELEKSSNSFDSIVGITREEKSHPSYLMTTNSENSLSSYIEGGFDKPIRRQELDSIFRMDGSLYLSKTSSLLKHRSFYQEKTIGYEVPEWKSLEIDSIVDFVCIEAIINNKEILEYE
jgi:N-acylneuraminate cytidylyltransferase/CMP-N,N'-diacetyllegionaminic acid synthase